MRVALMQPYFFPYVGYFELVSKVDLFIFYDDAAFSKNSWYNRNRILSPNKEFEYIRVSVAKEKLGSAVHSIRALDKSEDLRRCLSVSEVYKKAPHYLKTIELIRNTFDQSSDKLSSISSYSVINSCQFIGIAAEFAYTSDILYDRQASAEEKVISVCKAVGASEYVNLSGGRALYQESRFRDNNIKLAFTEPTNLIYDSGAHRPSESLSIIDTLMYCTPDEILRYINSRV